MYVGLKQPRGDGERYVTPARAAAKETKKTRAAAKSPDYGNEEVFKKLSCQLKMIFVHSKTRSRRFQVPPVGRTFSSSVFGPD